MKHRGPGITFAAALRELEIVHRRDQARLLREACAFAGGDLPLGRLYAAGWHASDIARRAWERACAEEIESARTDGFALDPTLRSLPGLPFDRWPRPTLLVRAALDLRPSRAGRLDLARARIAEGDTTGAIGELRAWLDEATTADDRGPALEALGLALECEGDRPAALACYAEAVREPRCDPRVSVALLALALRVPDPDGVSLAAQRLARLDLSVPGTRRRFDRALRAARGRAARNPGARIGWPILEIALAGSEACSEVARGLP